LSLDFGWGNGYVLVPEGHPYHGVSYEDIHSVSVHGGLTYSGRITHETITNQGLPYKLEHIGMWAFGFDTAHCYDTLEKWPKEAVMEETMRLKDQIDDVQQSVKAVSGTPIENFAGSFQLLQDKLKGGDFKGAASAINGISSSVKGLTFKEAIAGVGSFGSAMGGLGRALLTNPIFLLAAAIGAGVAALIYFRNEAEKLTKSTIEMADKAMERAQTQYDQQIRIMEILGKRTVEMERQKQKSIIETAPKEWLPLIKTHIKNQREWVEYESKQLQGNGTAADRKRGTVVSGNR